MVVLLAICLPVMLTIAAFSINVAYMELTRTELQIATDSATRAAGRQLVLSGRESDAIAQGIDAASRNFVGGAPLNLVSSDFEFGESHRSGLSSRYSFVPSTGQVNAVRVTGRKSTGSASGNVQLFMSSYTNLVDFEPVQQGISTQVELDMAIVIDRSGSMAYGVNESTVGGAGAPPASAPAGWSYGDPAPPDSRWRDTVAAVEAFLVEMNATPQNENITVVTYANDAAVEVDFTMNYNDFHSALDVYTQSFPSGATNIAGGITSGTNALANSGNSRLWAAKAIIVLTDGHQTAGSDPAIAATQAAAQGVAVYTVTFSNEADQTKMAEVASEGAGLHFHAETPEDLVEVFREIAKNLPTLLTK